MADPRTLPPEDPASQGITAETSGPRISRRNQREVREPQEIVIQTGIDAVAPDTADFDRGYADSRSTPKRTPREVTASPSLDQREWAQGPAATADQYESDSADVEPLFSEFEVDQLRSRWDKVQADFVDSPRHSVQAADELVATVVQRITSGFADERTSLEKQWDSGANVSTEDLRVALQRYRSFFGRLLSAA
jgi:hypothetical protein